MSGEAAADGRPKPKRATMNPVVVPDWRFLIDRLRVIPEEDALSEFRNVVYDAALTALAILAQPIFESEPVGDLSPLAKKWARQAANEAVNSAAGMVRGFSEDERRDYAFDQRIARKQGESEP